MKSFRNSVEIRLSKSDLKEAIEFWLNKQVIAYDFKNLKVTECSLHPSNKYVARIVVGTPK